MAEPGEKRCSAAVDYLMDILTAGDYWLDILTLIAIYGLLAMSLNIICGVTGLLQLGHAGFFAAGAYAAGLISIYATIPQLGPFNLVISCAGAMLAAAFFAVLIGLPCLRLHGDYLAIATLGFGEILWRSLSNIEFPGCEMTGGKAFGGATGLNLPSPLEYDISFTADYAHPVLIWAVLLLSYVFFLNVKHSGLGRAFLCIREDEVAARAMGINVPRKKMWAFLLSAVFAGLAGALLVHNAAHGMTVVPSQFTLVTSIQILLMVVLGGLGSFTGSLVAAAVLVLLPEVLRFVPPILGVSLGDKRQLIFAVLLIVLIRLAPGGLLGSDEMPAWLRRLIRRRRGAAQ